MLRVGLLSVCLAGCQVLFPLDPASDPDVGGDAAVDSDLSACPADFNGGRYLHVARAVSWGVAFQECRDLDTVSDSTFTHLLVLSDQTEALAVELPSEDAWVGLRKVVEAWRWVTGEFPDDANAPWDAGKPDQLGGDCANLEASTRQLDNSACAATKTFICECDGFAGI